MTRVLDRAAVLLGSAFYVGYVPFAPGTFGTLVGAAVLFPAAGLSLPAYLALTALVVAAGHWAAGRCQRIFGEKDSPRVVIDEVAGFLLAMTAVPVSPAWLAAGFLLFRLFDIIKPWPAGWIDLHLGGGGGVMLDDLVAGLYTLAVLQAALLLTG